MNRVIFRENLLKVIREIIAHENITDTTFYRFTILPIIEIGKKYDSKDDVMRLVVFGKDNLDRREFLELNIVVEMFSSFEPFYPLWIKASLKEASESWITFELQTSLRFRKPSLLQFQETGHPPFMAIFRDQQ